MRQLHHFSIDLGQASELLSFGFGEPTRARRMEPLSGGVGSVVLVEFDREPERAVLKLSESPGNRGFESQLKVLRFYKEHTSFPVQTPYFAAADGTRFPFSALCVEYLEGKTLGSYPMTAAQADALDVEMAEILAELHGHTHPTYKGVFDRTEHERWVDVYRPRFEKSLKACEGKLDESTWKTSAAVLAKMEDLFGDRRGPGRLIHGDIWACNVIVRPDEGGGYRISGFIDSGASYADVESELAYLLVFRTAGAAFFRRYQEFHPIDEGFPLRRLVYNLHTLLIHVHIFGDAHYHRGARMFAEELRRVVG